jgi:AMMECR1 domain-containing protein
MPETELLLRKAQAIPIDYVREAIDFLDFLILKAAQSGSLSMTKQERNTAFEEKISKARADLKNGKGIAVSMEQMEALENE